VPSRFMPIRPVDGRCVIVRTEARSDGEEPVASQSVALAESRPDPCWGPGHAATARSNAVAMPTNALVISWRTSAHLDLPELRSPRAEQTCFRGQQEWSAETTLVSMAPGGAALAG
jgi:hypothetical protein